MDKYRVEDLFRIQHHFQELCGLPISSPTRKISNDLAQAYLFRAIGEISELSRTLPNSIDTNKPERKEDRQEMITELADVVLFLINFMLVKNIAIQTLFEVMEKKQASNVKKIKELRSKHVSELPHSNS